MAWRRVIEAGRRRRRPVQWEPPGLPTKLALQEVEAGQQQRRRGQRVVQHGRQSLQPLG